jgi:5-(carboxyamino)imidazole ribonucleotide synthase
VLGLLVVEFFLTGDDRLLVNEIAPRPHNSGYYTLDACPTSQFEQLLRVLCHLPLGAAEPLMPSAMVNLLGDIWLTAGQPDFAAALALHGVKLHLYGKREARLGRKMGHLCALAPTTDLAVERALAARTQLARREG